MASLLLMLLLLDSCLSMDFYGALENDMFVDLAKYDADESVLAFTNDLSSKAFKVDVLDNVLASRKASMSGERRNFSILFRIDENDCFEQGSEADLELSLSILLLDSDNSAKVDVIIDDEFVFDVTKQRRKPEALKFELDQHLFRTWDHDDLKRTPCMRRSIGLQLTNWQDEDSIYFTSTLMERVREEETHHSLWSNGCVRNPLFGCHTQTSQERHQICIRTELYCDKLPNCGQQIVPNMDERCRPGMTLRNALLILIYTFSLLCLSAIVFNVIRSCVLARRFVRGRVRASSDASANSTRTRPPPNYDEVVAKDQLPPSYSVVANLEALNNENYHNDTNNDNNNDNEGNGTNNDGNSICRVRDELSPPPPYEQSTLHM